MACGFVPGIMNNSDNEDIIKKEDKTKKKFILYIEGAIIFEAGFQVNKIKKIFIYLLQIKYAL